MISDSVNAKLIEIQLRAYNNCLTDEGRMDQLKWVRLIMPNVARQVEAQIADKKIIELLDRISA